MHYKIAKVISDIECDLMYRLPLYINSSHPIIEWLRDKGIRKKIEHDTQKFTMLLKRRKNVNFMTIYNEWYNLFIEIMCLYDINSRGAYYLWEYGAVAAYDIVHKDFNTDEDINSDKLCEQMVNLLENYYNNWSVDKLFEVNYIFNKLNDCIIMENNYVAEVKF